MSLVHSHRSKFIGPTLCAVLVVVGLRFAFADAPAAPELSKVVSVAPLETSLNEYIEKVRAALTDEATYAKNKDQLGQKANSAVALLQVIGNHDEKSTFQGRDIEALMAKGREVVRSKDYATAKKAFDEFDALAKGTATSGNKPKMEKFASLGRLMKETAEVNGRLRRNVKRLAKTKADNLEGAAVLAAFAHATVYDTHEVKNPADLPKWYAMAVEMRDAAADLSKAVAADDEAGFKKSLERLDKTCAACHEVFHHE